jgi:hypothetical protein
MFFNPALHHCIKSNGQYCLPKSFVFNDLVLTARSSPGRVVFNLPLADRCRVFTQKLKKSLPDDRRAQPAEMKPR